MGDFDSLFTSLDPDPHRRGRQFERVCQLYLQTDPAFAPRLRRIWLWREWPGRWSDIDAGVDLVAEGADAKLWAIQAKAWAEHRRIPKRELNTFLAESSRAEFSYRLLITTSAAGLHPIAATTVAAQEKPVLVADRQALRASLVDWPATFEDLPGSPGVEDAGEPRVPADRASLLPDTEDLAAAFRVREPVDSRWERSFNLLEDFVRVNGHARVPSDYTVGGVGLGRWILHQRHLWARRRLSPAKERRLAALPGWVFSIHEAAWGEHFHQLSKFVATHGDARLPIGFEVDGFSLSAWATTQRTRYRTGQLAPHRARLLEALPGWSWDPFLDTWEEGVRHLQHCGELAGPMRLDYRCPDGFSVGRWVDRARAAAAAGRLTPERVEQLAGLAG